MDSISVNKFRENLKSSVEQVVSGHLPLKVTRRRGDDFVVLSADDWERQQETLYVLQNQDLMRQIAVSTATNAKNKGYKPTFISLLSAAITINFNCRLPLDRMLAVASVRSNAAGTIC